MKLKFVERLTAVTLSATVLLTPVAQALTTEQAAELLEYFYVGDIPQTVLEQPTISEMLAALGDPYTEYFTPDEYAMFNATMSDSSLVGIGVVSQNTEEGLLLNEVLEDSPAEQGGLQVGDIIIKVDGHSIVGEDSETAIGRIRGEEGTKVKITYLRNGKRKTVTLVRATVVIAATTTELLDNHIGYISCTTFGEETVQHFQEGLEKYEAQADVWIVDLRSNTGGSTQAAVDAAGCFTGKTPIAYLRDGADRYVSYYHEEDSRTLSPVIVLMDAYSASSSELFAAAIRDLNAGIVVGTRSFGKGVAQTVLDQSALPEYFPDGDAMKITSYRFFTPNGNSTDQVGVIPDLMVEPDMIGDVAYLLAGGNPLADTSGYLRLDFGWQWFIDLSIAEEYPEALQALLNAIPENKKLWLGTGGSTGWQRTEATAIAEAYDVEYQPSIFADQDDSSYGAAISILKLYGLLHGKEDGYYRPQDTLTRAELCQMLSMALNCDISTKENSYCDVSEDAWYAPAVTAMSNLGVVNGVGNGEFRPEDPVDHQQFITIMGRLGEWINMYLYNISQETPDADLNVVGLAEYDDWAKCSAWLLSYSQKGYFGNTIQLLWADAADIDPHSTTTRDEAAYTLYRLLSYIGILSA